MRRLLSLALLLAFSFGLTAQLVAGSEGLSVPECCRKLGKHHCGLRTPGGSAVAAKNCFVTPQDAWFTLGHSAPPAATETVWACALRYSADLPQVEAGRRISFSRTRQKRGPPISL